MDREPFAPLGDPDTPDTPDTPAAEQGDQLAPGGPAVMPTPEPAEPEPAQPATHADSADLRVPETPEPAEEPGERFVVRELESGEFAVFDTERNTFETGSVTEEAAHTEADRLAEEAPPSGVATVQDSDAATG